MVAELADMLLTSNYPSFYPRVISGPIPKRSASSMVPNGEVVFQDVVGQYKNDFARRPNRTTEYIYIHFGKVIRDPVIGRNNRAF